VEKETAVLVISDIHIGKKTSSYNTEVAETRHSNLIHNTLKVVDIIRKSYTIEDLHIFDLGDHIDNDNIYKTHPHHTDQQARYGREQCIKAVELFEPFLLMGTKYFDHIYVHGVRGNHGRVTNFTHEGNNWDLVFYDEMKLAMRGNERVTFNISEEFYEIVEIMGWKNLLYHGAGIKMYQNIPWYGAVQRVMRWEQSLKDTFNNVFMGHFHITGDMPWRSTNIFFNGTMGDNDDFCLEYLGMDGCQTYWLFGIHPEQGITWRYKINLLN